MADRQGPPAYVATTDDGRVLHHRDGVRFPSNSANGAMSDAPGLVPGLVRGSERVHVEGLENEVSRLRNGLQLIVLESEQFPDEDGIGAGTMARNILNGAPRT